VPSKGLSELQTFTEIKSSPDLKVHIKPTNLDLKGNIINHTEIKSTPNLVTKPDLKLANVVKLGDGKVPPENSKIPDFVSPRDLKSPRQIIKSPTATEMMTWDEEEIYNWAVNGLKIKEQHGQILKTKGITGQVLLQLPSLDDLGLPLLSVRIIWSELLTIKAKV